MVGVLVVMQNPDIRSILVVRLSSIGDIILTTPLLEELRHRFPAAVIDYCTKAPFLPLIASNPAVSRVFTPEDYAGGLYDLVVDLQNNSRSRALFRHTQAAQIRRYRKQNWKKVLLVRFKLNRYDGYHSVVERYAKALEGLTPSVSASCAIYPDTTDRAFAADAIGRGRPVLAICFGANHFTKRYPADGFTRIIGQVLASTPATVILTGGKEDIPVGEKIMNDLPEAHREMVRMLAGKATLMQSAALLEASDLVLCNDTGLMHMASAFNRKLFVIFGSSVSAFGFLPWGTPFELFETEGLRCRPCSHIGRSRCPKGHFRCMTDISPERISAKLIETINRLAV